LEASQVLEKNFNGELRVLSLGCGFGPDYIALDKYNQGNNLHLKLKYWGYDREENWRRITDGVFKHIPNIKDILAGFELNNYHIIFLNKLFSTMVRNKTGRQFLDLLINEINDSMSVGSVIVYNDVNNYKMGRDIIHAHLAKQLHVEGKYFFNIGGAYTGDYTEIPNTNNICKIPNGISVPPMQTATKSVFFAYKKIG
jgi:hypothetical protein